VKADRQDPGRPLPVELSIIVPTRDERENVPELVRSIEAALQGVAWELVIVDDDSPDGTAELARRLYRDDARVRCIRRVGRRGLASACLEGMLSTSAPLVAVMDADLQHDAALLPHMVEWLRTGTVDLVVASRYCADGSTEGWAPGRLRLSRCATMLSGAGLLQRLTDPLSGYFALRRELVEASAHRTSGIGFKILLDLVLSAPTPIRIQELPLVFRSRLHGQSKLDLKVVVDFALMLLDKRFGPWLPVRLIPFAMVGLLGVGVHYALMHLLFSSGVWSYPVAQAVSTVLTIAFNFAVNNEVTYASAALRGRRWLWGLGSFQLICGAGAVANVGVASLLYGAHTPWVGATAAGVIIGAVWNFAVSSRYTWRPG